MTLLSYLLRWSPLPLLAGVCLQDLGWWRAGLVLVVYLTVPRHRIVSVLVAVAGLVWLDIPYRYLVWALALRLGWDLGLKAAFARLACARQRRAPGPRLVPRLRCRHGLRDRVKAADRLHRLGLVDAATDAYLGILADHPVEPTCGRVLLLRTAEAARHAGDHTLAAELSAAALRGVPRDPTGRIATLAVRAHATRAAALAGLGDLVEATRGLRQAQRLTQANRATERYLRWTAVEVRLAGRGVRTFDGLSEEIAGALSEQSLSLRGTSGLDRLKIMMAWRLLGAGDAEGAERAFYSVRRGLDLGPGATGIRRPDGRLAVPAEYQPSWRMFTLAVAGEVAAAVAKGEQLSADDRAAADLATDLAWYFDENLTGARMLLARALFDRGRGGDAQTAVARLRRAQRFADLGLHTFADQRRQAEWLRLRDEIAAALRTIAGTVEPPPTSPWPVTPKEREQAEKARARAETVFDRLAANDPDAFGPARERLALRLDVGVDEVASRALWGPPAEGASAPIGQPPVDPRTRPATPSGTRSEAQPATQPEAPSQAQRATRSETRSGTQPRAKPEAQPAASPSAAAQACPPRADPEWLETLMAAGGRCWTLTLALDQARALGHHHVGAEHLLLAVAYDGACAEILAGLDVSADDLRATVGSWYARTGTHSPTADPELTTLVRVAASIAGALGDGRVRAVHLLMALLTNPHGAGGAVLRATGADPEETRVRVDAALAGPILRERAGPLFAAGEIVHHHRLTLPSWLAIGWALDLAAADLGGILGPEHLARGVQAYESKAPPPLGADGRATVRIGRTAREILAGARCGADAAGEWGIDLDHLRGAIRGDAPAADPPSRSGTRAACALAARRGAHFVTPEDIRQTSRSEGVRRVSGSEGVGQASGSEGGDGVLPPVPVLTPAARRARDVEWSAS